MADTLIERLAKETDTRTVVNVLGIENIVLGWPKISKGIFYFATEDAAKTSARAAGWPTDRAIEYGKGWAVQAGKSGNYFGPGNVLPRPWDGRTYVGPDEEDGSR